MGDFNDPTIYIVRGKNGLVQRVEVEVDDVVVAQLPVCRISFQQDASSPGNVNVELSGHRTRFIEED